MTPGHTRLTQLTARRSLGAAKSCALALAMLAPSLALAADAIGKISALEGAGTRQGTDGQSADLAVGTEVMLGDKLSVKKGIAKLELNDGSVIGLSEKSEFEIKVAEFQGQVRSGNGFLGFLKSGSIWSSVKKAAGVKFEVETERAVAGVRGTIFRIDANAVVKGAKVSVVKVKEGIVNVRPGELTKRMSKNLKKMLPKGPRVEVPGPAEVSADQWEKIFVDLQANQKVVVGADLFEQSQLAEKEKADAFDKWFEKQNK